MPFGRRMGATAGGGASWHRRGQVVPEQVPAFPVYWSPGELQRCALLHSLIEVSAIGHITFGRVQTDADPGARDAEELIEVQRCSIPDLQALLVSGNMLLPSVATCFISLERLRQLGHLPGS